MTFRAYEVTHIVITLKGRNTIKRKPAPLSGRRMDVSNQAVDTELPRTCSHESQIRGSSIDSHLIDGAGQSTIVDGNRSQLTMLSSTPMKTRANRRLTTTAKAVVTTFGATAGSVNESAATA